MFTGRRLSGFGSGHATPRSRRQERARSQQQQQQHREPCDPVAPCGLQLSICMGQCSRGQRRDSLSVCACNQPPAMLRPLCLLCSARMAAYLGSKLGRVARLLSGDGDDFAASTPNSLNSPGGPLAGGSTPRGRAANIGAFLNRTQDLFSSVEHFLGQELGGEHSKDCV